MCSVSVTNEDMTVEFPNLVIQRLRRKEIAEVLRQRQEISVDPFRQGFDHANNPETIAMDAVKLCFEVNFVFQYNTIFTTHLQVFLENPETPGTCTVRLPPLCSNTIFDRRSKTKETIVPGTLTQAVDH